MDELVDTKEAVIFDLDNTLVFEKEGRIIPREDSLASMLRKLVDAGKKLFVISATDPAPSGTDHDQWVRQERERKLTELEVAGLPSALFRDLLISLPLFDCPYTSEHTARIIELYAQEKARCMTSVLRACGIDPSRALSIGDRADIEGVASEMEGIPYIRIPAASRMQPTDTLQWILRMQMLGETEQIPEHKVAYSREEVLEKPVLAETFIRFQSAFEEYVRTRNWRILTALEIPIPEIRASSYQNFRGNLQGAWDAAMRLRTEYDLVIGIARNGLWLSFIFTLQGANVKEVYLLRNGLGRVFCPINGLWRKDIEGKRILLIDNDALTGQTINAAVERLLPAGPRVIDALFIYRYTYPEGFGKYTFAESASHKGHKYLDIPRVIGYIGEQPVLDSHAQLRQIKGLRRTMFLDQEFRRRKEEYVTMKELRRRLKT